MGKTRDFLNNFLYEIDFFKVPFTIMVEDSRTKLSTKLGSFFSIVIGCFLLYLFFSSDMVLKKNPLGVSQVNSVRYRPKIELGTSRFQLNFQIFDKQFNGYKIDPTIFGVYISKIQFSFTEKGQNMTQTPINFTECPNTTNYTYCINEGFDVEGFPYLTSNTSFLIIDLMACNSDNPANFCKDEAEINEFFVNKGIFFSYTDNQIDFNNYEEPIQQSITSDFTWLDPKISKFLNIYIKKLEFYDDTNIFSDSPKITESFCKDFSSWDLTTTISLNKAKGAMLEVFFMSSNNIQKTKRTYQKIDQVLASLAGIFNTLFLAIFFVVSLQNNLKFSQFIISSLYSYENSDKRTNRKYENEYKITTKEQMQQNPIQKNKNKFAFYSIQQENGKNSFYFKRLEFNLFRDSWKFRNTRKNTVKRKGFEIFKKPRDSNNKS